VHSFSETDKLSYGGIRDDGTCQFYPHFEQFTHPNQNVLFLSASNIENMFHFTCFNVEDPHDPSVGLINGELSIPGNLLRREVFDPVVNEVSNIFYLCPIFHDEFDGSKFIFRPLVYFH